MSQDLSFTEVIKRAPRIVIYSDDSSESFFERQPHDRKYYDKPYGEGIIEGSGSLDDPYQYKCPMWVSPHYGIIDLWFTLRHMGNVIIAVNDVMFELHPTGVKSSHGCFTRLLPKNKK